MEAKRNIINLKRKTPDAFLNDQDLIAAEILYELANSTVRLVDNNLTALSDIHSTDDTRQHVDDMVTKFLLASLPAPPLHLMQAQAFSARFNKKAKASQRTIEESCNAIRVHFQKEEAIRYLIPDRSFKYTTLDGRKCLVASLRKGNEKSLTKSKRHCMFKVDRPPHITLCSLVTDAAARLPGGIGTIADLCTLVRDSQYIVEDISDEVMTKVVRGALNRLGSKLDPCVKFEAGLWTYMHGNREEVFRDDGTSFT